MDFFFIGLNDQFMELVIDVGVDGGNVLGMDFFIDMCFMLEAIININILLVSDLLFIGSWVLEGVWFDFYGDDKNFNGIWQLLMIDDMLSVGGMLYSWIIIFNLVYEIIYEWQFVVGLSCVDCFNLVVILDIIIIYILNVIDFYGCIILDMIMVEVIEGFGVLVLNCVNVMGSSVMVNWEEVVGVIGGYEVSVDGGLWMLANGFFDYIVNNLGFLIDVIIEVCGVGDCFGFFSIIICQILDCVFLNVILLDIMFIICNGGSDGGVEVSVFGIVGLYQFVLNGVENMIGIFNGLVVGIYQVVVVDGVNCGIILSIMVIEFVLLEIIG